MQNGTPVPNLKALLGNEGVQYCYIKKTQETLMYKVNFLANYALVPNAPQEEITTAILRQFFLI